MVELPELRLNGVVCDQHLTDMRFGSMRIRHGFFTSALEGWKCMDAGCKRFFGRTLEATEVGYADLDSKEDLVNFRTEPACMNEHPRVALYLGRRDGSLQWICGACDASRPA